MNKVNSQSSDTVLTIDPGKKDVAHATRFSDPVYPFWAKVLSALFSVSSAIGWLSVSVLSLFIIDLAVENQDTKLIYVLATIGAAGLLAGYVLDVTHSRAIVGLSRARIRTAKKTQAVLALFLGLFLSVIHPALGLGLLLCLGLQLLLPLIFKRFPQLLAQNPLSHLRSVALFAGRNPQAYLSRLEDQKILPEAVVALGRFANGAAVLTTLAVAAWLSVKEILTPGALVATILMAYWAAQRLTDWFAVLTCEPRETRAIPAPAPPDTKIPEPDPFEDISENQDPPKGLVVHGLTVKSARSRKVILSPAEFEVAAGQILGLTGDSGAGKSTLLNAISGHTNAQDLMLRGFVAFDNQPLWQKNSEGMGLPAILVPETPLLLQGTAVDNLMCFDPDKTDEDAQNALLKLDVIGVQTARIMAREDALSLSAAEAQILSLARAFHLNPRLYLLDMPENNLTTPIIGCLANQLRIEANAGRSCVIATRNRALLDVCDRLLLMDDGFVVDRGPAKEVMMRQSSGWARLVLKRTPDSEERLHNWMRSRFNRRGDEKNQRNACLLASELLALSCEGKVGKNPDLIIDFRHFKGSCDIHLQDTDATISSAQLKTAAKLAKGSKSLSPHQTLANIFKLSSQILQDIEDLDVGFGRRIKVSMTTYDPRQSASKGHQANAD